MTIGIDLSKQSYSVHGVGAHGKVMLRKTLSRAKLLRAGGPSCLRSHPPLWSPRFPLPHHTLYLVLTSSTAWEMLCRRSSTAATDEEREPETQGVQWTTNAVPLRSNGWPTGAR
jgi:hypothetical protein